MSFSDFNLKEDFISSIEAAGYQSPTPLQSQLIPLVAEKKSALVWTQSASGKTGAFLIPAINYILENPAPEKRGARILILTSRRDRVSQINYTIKRLSRNHIIRFGFIVSGRPYQTQMRLMRRPLDIMIATPGRLSDLMNNGKADFSQLEMLIIDDLASVYKKNLHGLIEKIIEQAGDECSTLAFVRGDEEITPYAKALFPDAIEIFMDEDSNPHNVHNANEPVAPKVAEQHQEEVISQSKEKIISQEEKPQSSNSVKAADLMPQKVHIADDYTHKIAMMDHLMDEFAGESTMIYVATNKAAKILQENLSNHGHAAELVQDLSTDEINDCDIIIYSDQENPELSAEQMTANDQHIIHFDLPRRTDKYIERLMRHDQNREDAALLMIDGYNYNELKHIEKTIGEKLEQTNVPGLEPLKPFVNLSKSRATNKPNNNKQRKHSKNSKPRQNNRSRANNGKAKNKTNNNNRNKQNTIARSNSNSSESSPDNKQRRQRKGAFGRLNGGANRKTANTNGGRAGTPGRKNNSGGRRNPPKVGVSSRGTGVPQGGRGWQSDFAAPKERVAESKNVVIRYSKKRTIVNDDKKNEES